VCPFIVSTPSTVRLHFELAGTRIINKSKGKRQKASRLRRKAKGKSKKAKGRPKALFYRSGFRLSFAFCLFTFAFRESGLPFYFSS
jgi:hypothetical protein